MRSSKSGGFRWRNAALPAICHHGDMATVHIVGVYSYDLGSVPLAPGQSYWVSWTSEAFENSAVILTPHPYVGGRRGVMSVGDVFVTREAYFSGDIEYWSYHVGASITNGGPEPIRYFDVTVGVIKPGPDGH